MRLAAFWTYSAACLPGYRLLSGLWSAVTPGNSADVAWLKAEKKWIKALFFKTTKASQELLPAMWCEKTRIFSSSSSSSWLLLNNWKLSKAEQFGPSEWEKILQWARVVRRQEKKGLRFVISLPCVVPLLRCSSPGLCKEKVIRSAIQLVCDIYTVSP